MLIIVGIVVALGLGSYFYTIQIPAKTPEFIATEAPTSLNNEATTTPTVVTTTTSTTTTKPTTTPAPIPTTPPTPSPTPTVTTTYKSAKFEADTTYTVPSRAKHTVLVTLTITDDIVTDTSITFGGDTDKTSTGYQTKFEAAYQAQVVGKSLDSISLSRVAGASLTTGAYNNALAQIKTAAKL